MLIIAVVAIGFSATSSNLAGWKIFEDCAYDRRSFLAQRSFRPMHSRQHRLTAAMNRR